MAVARIASGHGGGRIETAGDFEIRYPGLGSDASQSHKRPFMQAEVDSRVLAEG